ncbi:hypothetical protein QS257_08005 [Terrilactibacillus sp. S3-3]|nr:hypothetical protein QS257_08005 [Terrilactibacillus sp. S3-3]
MKGLRRMHAAVRTNDEADSQTETAPFGEQSSEDYPYPSILPPFEASESFSAANHVPFPETEDLSVKERVEETEQPNGDSKEIGETFQFEAFRKPEETDEKIEEPQIEFRRQNSEDNGAEKDGLGQPFDFAERTESAQPTEAAEPARGAKPAEAAELVRGAKPAEAAQPARGAELLKLPNRPEVLNQLKPPSLIKLLNQLIIWNRLRLPVQKRNRRL